MYLLYITLLIKSLYFILYFIGYVSIAPGAATILKFSILLIITNHHIYFNSLSFATLREFKMYQPSQSNADQLSAAEEKYKTALESIFGEVYKR
jgi:hypothetical protein